MKAKIYSIPIVNFIYKNSINVLLKTKVSFTFILLFLFFAQFTVFAQCPTGTLLRGNVYVDNNQNGVDAGTVAGCDQDPGLGGMIVRIYTMDGVLLQSVTTDASGNWASTSAVPGTKYRVEFLKPSWALETLFGTDNGTAVQIADGGACLKYGVIDPGGVCEANPDLLTICYVNGQAVSSDGALVKVNNAVADGNNPAAQMYSATAAQVGAGWGIAHSRKADCSFTSAFLKRHHGFGPLGIGGIYRTCGLTTTNFIDLTTLGIDFDGSGVYTETSTGNVINFSPNVGTVAERGLPIAKQDPSRDIAAFAQIGRVGMGDMDISTDDRYLFVVNLYDKLVYKIDLQNPSNPVVPGAAQVSSFATANPCGAGISRPFALTVRQNKVYVGIVCENATNAYVYSYDLNGGSETLELTIPLGYTRGQAYVGQNGDWKAWNDDWLVPKFTNFQPTVSAMNWSTPILSDIEFADNGDMIIGIMDRTGHQFGWANWFPTTTDPLYSQTNQIMHLTATGDILKVWNNNGVWTLENNGAAGCAVAVPVARTTNGQGPGTGEFYNDNLVSFHNEITVGGLVVVPGTNQVAHTAIDPVISRYDAFGIQWQNNSTGDRVKGYEIFFSGFPNSSNAATQGKGAALGDIEALCSALAPIEIGNYVWLDTDGDGIQDPIETPLSGINVSLYDSATGALIGTEMTNADGGYYFNSIEYPAILPNTSYTIVVGTGGQFTGGALNVGGNAYPMTAANMGVGDNVEYNDSEGIALASGLPGALGMNTGLPSTVVTTPDEGANHTYDFGFTSVPTCTLSANCSPTPQTSCTPSNGSATVTPSGGQGNITYLWSSGETTSSISNKAAGTYTVTVTDDFLPGCTATCQAIIANNANAPTCAITVNTQPSCANLTGGVITVAPSPAGTYTYNWSDIGTGSANRSGLIGGTYTVTVTNTTTNCTGVCNITLATPTNCCNIQAIVPQNIVCLDNGTPLIYSDNRIRFNANVTNTNTSLTGYNVTINGGTTITPNINVPYGVTQFTLGTGTAGGGATFTITVTDSATTGCSQTFTVTDPGGCNNAIPCPEVNCGTSTIQVNGN